MRVREAVFIDTVGWIALVHRHDDLHGHVLQLYRSLGKILRVTTDAILIESCNSFSKTTLRALAVALMENIKRAEQLGILEIIHVCEEHISQAWELFKTCMDKEWSLTDCINTNALNKMTSPSPSPLEGEGWVGGKKI